MDVPEYCIASVYTTKDHLQNGTKTASGIPLDDSKPTAAHKTVPLRSFIRVTNVVTGKEMVLQVTDRGPFIKGRCVDLSAAAAKGLGISGLGRVKVQPERR